MRTTETSIDRLVVRQFPEVAEFLLIVEENSQTGNLLKIQVEPIPDLAEPTVRQLLVRITELIHDRLYFRPEIELVPPQSLPRFEMKARRLRPIQTGNIV